MNESRYKEGPSGEIIDTKLERERAEFNALPAGRRTVLRAASIVGAILGFLFVMAVVAMLRR